MPFWKFFGATLLGKAVVKVWCTQRILMAKARLHLQWDGKEVLASSGKIGMTCSDAD